MARYKIVRRLSTSTDACVVLERKRKDAAILQFQREVYNALEASGLRDTRHAHQCMEDAHNWEEGQSLRAGSYNVSWWRYE